MSDDDQQLPIPVAALAVVAVVGVIFIGVAIAICCYFCVPRNHKFRRLFGRLKRSRTAPIDGGGGYEQADDDAGETNCQRCCRGAPPWRDGYTQSELERGVVLIEPYVIEVGVTTVTTARQPLPPPPPVAPRRPPSTALPAPATVHPTDQLVFTKLLGDRVLSSYPEKVILECELNKPNINVVWTRNGFPVDNRRSKTEGIGRVHRLTIDHCDPNDEGTYECAAVVPLRPNDTITSSDVLKTTCRVDIKIKPTLQLDKYLNKTIEVKVGQAVYFHLPFSGHPRPQITARFNGDRPLPDTARMTIADVGRDQVAIFTINDAERTDSGTYLITAENDSGRVYGELLLSVKDRPGVPRDFNVISEIAAPSSWKVSWLKPSDDGGAPLEGFVIEKQEQSTGINNRSPEQPWQPLGHFSPQTLQAGFADLKQNLQYIFRIAAFNKYGVSDWATVGMLAQKEADVPGKPGPPNLAEASQSRCRVNWAPPLTDGGSPITRYVLEYAEAGSINWLPVPRQPASTLAPLTLPVANLSANKKYQFRVAAENKVGLGPFSEPSRPISAKDQFTVPTKPDPPRVNDIFKHQCRVNWQPPDSDGGSAITGYLVERAEVGTNQWEPLRKISSTTLPLPLTLPVNNLDENNKYQFRVAAENKAGRGPFSDPSVPIVAKDPWEPPGKPKPPIVSDVSKTKCHLNWRPPVDDGGAPITGFQIERSPAGTNSWDPVAIPAIPTLLSTLITNLNETNQYQFRVAAENRAGRGPFSDPSEPITAVDPSTVPDKPGAPTITDVTKNSCKVHWVPPASDGGEPIVDYIVETTPVDKPELVRESPVGKPALNHTIGNLEPNEKYQFQVRAVNKVGKGEPSDPSQPVRIPVVVDKRPPSSSPKKVIKKKPKQKPDVEKKKPMTKPEQPRPRPPRPTVVIPPTPPEPPPLRQVTQVDAGFCNCGPGISAPPPPQPRPSQQQPKTTRQVQKPQPPPKQQEMPKQETSTGKPEPPPKQRVPSAQKRPNLPPRNQTSPKQPRQENVVPKGITPEKAKRVLKKQDPPPQKQPEVIAPPKTVKPDQPKDGNKKVPNKEKPLEPKSKQLPPGKQQEPPKTVRKVPPGSSISMPTTTGKRVTFATDGYETPLPPKKRTNEWDRQIRTPPEKKQRRGDDLDKPGYTSRPDFNLYFANFEMPLNSVKRHDITRKVTEY